MPPTSASIPEASEHVDRTIALIRELGCKPGLVFNPATPLDYLDYTLDHLDLVLIMSVNPGFGGQKFIHGALEKLAEVRRRIDASGRAVRLEVDGGVKAENIGAIARAGADTFVAGSAIFSEQDYGAVIRAMRQNIERGADGRPRPRPRRTRPRHPHHPRAPRRAAPLACCPWRKSAPAR